MGGILYIIMYIKVKVSAGAKEEKFQKKSDSSFIIKVKEKAERNMANKKVVEIISKHFGTKNVRIVSGHQSTAKILSVDDNRV